MSEIDKVHLAAGDRPFGCQTFYGYFTQVWIGRLRLHVFIKADPGEAMHDHPWSFVSLPFVSYVEEYLHGGEIKRQVIPMLRLNRKPATHAHRYLGRWSGRVNWKGEPSVEPGAVITLCWRGKGGRAWRYWRQHRGVMRSHPWRTYLRQVGQRASKHDAGFHS